MLTIARSALLLMLIFIILAICCPCNHAALSSNVHDQQQQLEARYKAYAEVERQNTSVVLYKEPSSWLINILKEMFSDIDWRAIEEAREQIEKFIKKVDRIIGSFRSVISKATATSAYEDVRASSREGKMFSGHWWGSNSGKQQATESDTTSIKEMLERVSCFVGYMRLMNLSNEALAELDASKVITNLFGASKRNSSAWSWFG